MRMACGLADDVDDAPIMLPLHGGQHGLYHREKPEHLVAQLAFENIERRAFDRAAQVCSGVVDEDIDASECR